jgi:hypothetical protein
LVGVFADAVWTPSPSLPPHQAPSRERDCSRWSRPAMEYCSVVGEKKKWVVEKQRHVGSMGKRIEGRVDTRSKIFHRCPRLPSCAMGVG